jgi:5-methylcytosine-specific restriction enzyme A
MDTNEQPRIISAPCLPFCGSLEFRRARCWPRRTGTRTGLRRSVRALHKVCAVDGDHPFAETIGGTHLATHQKLYGSARWRRRSRAQLMAEPLCTFCLAQGQTTAATTADHVKRHGGDERLFWEGELQSLCTSHHSGTKQQRESKKGFARDIGLDGCPLDPNHPCYRRTTWARG